MPEYRESRFQSHAKWMACGGVFVGLVFSSCGSDNPAAQDGSATATEEAAPTATPTIATTSTPVATNTPLATSTPRPPNTATPVPLPTATPTPDLRVQQMREYLDEGFGQKGYETSWYSSIGAITISGSTVEVQTPLGKDAASRQLATGVCAGVSGYIFANPNKGLGLTNIVVRAADGSEIWRRTGLGGKCVN